MELAGLYEGKLGGLCLLYLLVTLAHGKFTNQLFILGLDFIEPAHAQDSPNQFDSPFA